MANDTPTDRVQIVGALESVWTSVATLGAELSDEAWRQPTRLPGWRVTDVVAHLIGVESMLLGRPQPDVEVDDAPHLRNDIGRFNEAWVAAFAHRAPAEVLAEFVAVTDERLRVLSHMSQEQFDEAAWTPAGLATYGRFMQIRVFDCWMHLQDVRQAIGRPGDLEGPAVEVSLAEVALALGYVVGKRASAPSGSSVVLVVGGPRRRRFDVVVTDRARVSAQPVLNPTATVTCDLEVFAALVGGRSDPAPLIEAREVVLAGDLDLATRVATNLAFVI